MSITEINIPHITIIPQAIITPTITLNIIATMILMLLLTELLSTMITILMENTITPIALPIEISLMKFMTFILFTQVIAQTLMKLSLQVKVTLTPIIIPLMDSIIAK